jgi:phage baseplate assembly protein W
MNLRFPYQLDASGRTARSGDDAHIREMIEQLLFTRPGERVNRPEFGSGVMQLVFAPNSPELAATTQFLIQSALQQWLGDWITVERVAVEAIEARLRIEILYVNRRTQQRVRAELSHGGAP